MNSKRWVLVAAPASLLIGAAASRLKLWHVCREPTAEACVWGKAYYPVALPLETLLFGAFLFMFIAVARSVIMRRKVTHLLAAVLLSGACSGDSVAPSNGITIRAQQSSYERGEFVRITVTNRSEGAILIDDCFTTLEHRRSNQWETVIAIICITIPPGQITSAERWTSLAAGEVTTDSLRIPAHAPSGTHRVRYRIRLHGGMVLPDELSASTHFRVE